MLSDLPRPKSVQEPRMHCSQRPVEFESFTSQFGVAKEITLRAPAATPRIPRISHEQCIFKKRL